MVEDITIRAETTIKENSKIMAIMPIIVASIMVEMVVTLMVEMVVKNGKIGMKIKREIKINHLEIQTEVILLKTAIKINQGMWIRDQIIQEIQIEEDKLLVKAIRKLM